MPSAGSTTSSPAGRRSPTGGVYTPEALRAEYLRSVAPEAHDHEVAQGYLPETVEEVPSVVTLTMRAASACMTEFILRAYAFRHEPNRVAAQTLFSLATARRGPFRRIGIPVHAQRHPGPRHARAAARPAGPRRR